MQSGPTSPCPFSLNHYAQILLLDEKSGTLAMHLETQLIVVALLLRVNADPYTDNLVFCKYTTAVRSGCAREQKSQLSQLWPNSLIR